MLSSRTDSRLASMYSCLHVDDVNMLHVLTGPGLKPANEATRDYLEQVAIQYARGLANGSVKKTPRKKNLQESKSVGACNSPFLLR